MGTRLAQEEIDMWRRRYEMTERELRELESNRGRMKRDNEKMSEKVNMLQDRVEALERENRQYSTDIKDYQLQLQSQRESLLQQRDSEGVHTRDKEIKLKQYRDIIDVGVSDAGFVEFRFILLWVGIGRG
jgi:chromosome segregation ATPase